MRLGLAAKISAQFDG